MLSSTLALLLALLTVLPQASPPRSGDGVPAVDPDYSLDVSAWWARHPFNPASPTFVAEIVSPTPVLDVQAQYGGNLQSAIDALPPTGGTLFLAPGTYGRFELLGRSNVHIRGADAATVFIRGGMLFGCELARQYTPFQVALNRNDAAAVDCARGRPHNVYVRDVTFDGADEPSSVTDHTTAGSGIFMRAYRDVVFDRVTFQHYTDPRDWHPGLVSGNGLVDNAWCWQCTFVGRSRYGWFVDGCHGCGVRDSRFEAGFASGRVLHLTNEDFTHDLNGDGVFSPDELRNAQYNVIVNNTFLGGYGPEIVAVTGAQTLVEGNTVSGFVNQLARFVARCSQRWAHRGVIYENYGNQVLRNQTDDIQQLTVWEGESGLMNCPSPEQGGRLGRYLVRDNVVRNAPHFQTLTVEKGPVVGPNVVLDNQVN